MDAFDESEEFCYVDLGEEERTKALNDLVKKVKDTGLSPKGTDSIGKLFFEFVDGF